MRVNVKFGGTIYNELREKMATIKDTDSFIELCDTYGWNEAIAAFVETNKYFDEDNFTEYLEEVAFDIIVDFIDDAIKAKTDANDA